MLLPNRDLPAALCSWMFLLAVPACSRHYEGVADGDGLHLVGRAVAARRGQLGMTQQDLAGASGVDLKTVYNLESGTRWPIARNRVAISAALGWEGDGLAAIRAGLEPVMSGASAQDPAPVLPQETAQGPRRFPWLYSEELEPFLRVLRRELAEAVAVHGPEVRGADVFSDDLEAAVWDEPSASPDESMREIARLRMLLLDRRRKLGRETG